MDKREFMQGIHILQDAYNQKFSTDKLKLYYENLKNMSIEEYLKRVNKLIRTNTFMPSIAEILNQNKSLENFDNRDYSNIDFEKFYINIERGGMD